MKTWYLSLLGVGAAAWACLGLQAADPAEWVTLKGQVVWGGASIPERAKLNITKDQEHCLSKGQILSDELVVNPQNKGVQHVFVWLAPEGTGKLPIHPSLEQPKSKMVEMDQPICMFVPHCLAMREGQVLNVKNSAPVAHNVNWSGSPAKNPGGNVIIPAGKDHKIENLKADRRAVTIACNIHPWMKAYVRVFDHPYFAVTDADGAFEIKQAPAGKYRLFYWSDGGWKGGAAGSNGDAVTLKPGQVNDLGKVEWKP